MENTFDHFPSVAAETECNGGLVTTFTVRRYGEIPYRRADDFAAEKTL